MKLFRKSFTIFFLFSTCCASLTWAQPLSPDCLEQEKRDNEFVHSGHPNGNFYCNHLMNNASASFVSSTHVANEKYVIDKKESVVTWKGSMVLADDDDHSGYVYISKGELMIENGQLVGGTVEIDMNTIEYKDKEHTNSPVQHLKSSDFFDVEKFPTSTFEITSVASVSGENIKVTGKLTIKGITHAVTFPAKMEVKGEIVNASGKVIIDRTQWGIRYKSGKFYDNLADEAISDDIEFDMKIVAKK